MTAKPRTIDEYLAALTEIQCEALTRLRRAIRTAAPDAEECISYGIPAFRLHEDRAQPPNASWNNCTMRWRASKPCQGSGLGPPLMLRLSGP